MSTGPVNQETAPAMARWRRWAERVWSSPTANTWMSLFSRSASLVLVLPLILRKFSEAEAGVWFVFSAVLAVQGVIGFGFSPSFARLLAYARAGAEVEDMRDLRANRPLQGSPGINWTAIDRLMSCMIRVFAGLGAISLVLMASVGTWAVWRPISLTGHAWAVWAAWGAMAAGASLGFWTALYTAVLQGMDRLTDWRRAETVLSLGSITSAFLVLLAGGGILAVTLTFQAWGVTGLLTYRRLCRRALAGRFEQLGRRTFERVVFGVVWNSAWKSGLTSILTYGLVQSTGVIQAQTGTPAATATYNFMLRVVTVIAQVVQAPFLTKMPELARLRALGDLARQRALIRRGIRLTHWSIALAVAGVAVGMPLGLKWIGSRSVVFDPILWSFFATNLFFERHGGMLHQIRNLTNQPMEHIGMVGYFGCNVTLMLLLHATFGMYTFPLAMLGTQLIFAVWFNGAIAYSVLEQRAWEFERDLSFPPFLAVMATVLVLVWTAAPN